MQWAKCCHFTGSRYKVNEHSRLNLKLDDEGRPSFQDAPGLTEGEPAEGLIHIPSDREAKGWLRGPGFFRRMWNKIRDIFKEDDR